MYPYEVKFRNADSPGISTCLIYAEDEEDAFRVALAHTGWQDVEPIEAMKLVREEGIQAALLEVVERALGGAVMGEEDWHKGHDSPSCPLVRRSELRAEILDAETP